jgi:hypothetical protein
MEIKDFDKIVKMKERLDYLKILKYQINGKKVILSYMIYDDYEKNYLRIGSGCIRDILQSHDEQIRKEIDEEINKIYKEIEEI